MSQHNSFATHYQSLAKHSAVNVKKSGTNDKTSKLLIELFKDVIEIWNEQISLAEYFVLSHLVVKKHVIQGAKVHHFIRLSRIT